jgi:RHS repeat-associated protein
MTDRLSRSPWMLLVAGLFVGLISWAIAADSARTSAPTAASTALAGASRTRLPDGSWLVLGGRGASGGITGQGVILDDNLQPRQVLSHSLTVPRAGQSATVLPDGSVLIIGGVGPSGQPVGDVERFHPDTQTFEDLGNFGPDARSGQSATLLTDGRVLLVGGADVSSLVHADALLIDPTTLRTTAAGILGEARSGQAAQLLSNGDVLISGGHDQAGKQLATAELYNATTGQFQSVSDPAAAQRSANVAGPAVAATQPRSASAGVQIDTRLSARFSEPLQPGSLTDQTVTLMGPNGPVDSSVVAAEGGMLVFVTPKQQLLPGSRYTLFVKGAQDAGHRPLPFTAVDFQTVSLPAPEQRKTTAAPVAAARPDIPDTEPDDTEMWVPAKRNLTGVWRSGQASLAKKHAPAHKMAAPAGVTALSGQVLRLNGQPLAAVTLSVGGKSAVTDSNGEFLLSDLPSGGQTLVIDGSTADRQRRHYGRYEYRATIEAGKTNALPFVIWMTRLDTKHQETIASPTATETVLTNPGIPGLELHIPAGTVIRDDSGKVVTQLTMTPIPVDQPPFPLPHVAVPVYFTIQPGGAHLHGLTAQASQGARLIYPNFANYMPGTRVDFWNYDSKTKGWYVYGQGTVSADRKQIVPDPGVVIYEFTGAMIGSPGDAPGDGPPGGGGAGGGCGAGAPGGGGSGGGGGGGGDPGAGGGSGGCGSSDDANSPDQSGDPIDSFSGLFVYDRVDLVVRDVIAVQVRRTYRPRDPASRSFGVGTSLSYDIYLVGDINPWTYQDLVLPNGGRVHYTRTSPGTSYTNAVYGTVTPGRYFGSTITWNGSSWDLRLPSGALYTFRQNEGGLVARCGGLVGQRDRFGNSLTFVRDNNCNLSSVTSPDGRRIAFTYDTSNRITQASDDIGRTVIYQYDTSGRLTSVTDPAGKVESYTYDSSSRMLTVTDKRGNLRLSNTYDSGSRVLTQSYVDGTSSSFAYTVNSSGVVTQTDYTDTRGAVKRVTYNSAGYPASKIVALGKPEQQTVTYARDVTTNLASSETDSLGRTTAYQYDSSGHITQVTYLSGTPDAVTWSYTYEPTFGQLVTTTDPLNHVTTNSYDSLGNKIKVTDALGNYKTMTYNPAGQVTSSSVYVGGRALTTTYTYNGGDLASVTDPLNRTSLYFTDPVGRRVAVRDALGNVRTVVYDALDRVTQMTDPLGDLVRKGYDANGNLTSFTDPRGNATTFAYDARNRITTVTDPEIHTTTYAYDAIGNRTQMTDRKGQVSGSVFDFLNRLTSVGFGATAAQPTSYSNTIAYTWDAGNRVTQLVDSQAGTINQTFDGLDRETQEQSPQGQVNYSYYANGLRQSLTVQGQTPVTYSYDNDNQLAQIVRGGATVNYTYDTARRRTGLTLPNGIQATYGLDDANQLTSLTYLSGTTTVGALAYTYDAVGRRTGAGGSLANTALPAAVTTAAYDVDNRLTSFGGTSFTYDDNGNMTGMGTSTYAWDARNRLVATSDGTGAFAYDAYDRRVSQTVAGNVTTYLYDSDNAVNVNGDFMLNGLRADEEIARIAPTGTSTSFLKDALGSTVALSDGSGATTASYSYEPYGVTTKAGSDSTPFQFTGRENDSATGLYYYRARYYSARLGRFISEDPLGISAGANVYEYAHDDPVKLRDPSGLDPYRSRGRKTRKRPTRQQSRDCNAIESEACETKCADRGGVKLCEVGQYWAIISMKQTDNVVLVVEGWKDALEMTCLCNDDDDEDEPAPAPVCPAP